MDKEKQMGKKKIIYIFCIILILQCAVIIMWAGQKERIHVDEMFTMEGAKQNGIGMRYWDLAEDFYGAEHTKEEFLERLTVNYDDLIINEGTANVVERLIHGKFYYVIVNLVSSIRPGFIPWDISIGLNLICFLISQIVLYLIAKENFGDICALFSTALYGFSAGAVSTVLYARCYMMLAMYALLLIYVFLRFIKASKAWQRVLCIVCSEVLALLSYLTHQFGAILFILITGMCILYMLINRKKDALIWLGVGYGIPLLLGGKVIFNKIKVFFTNGVAPTFYNNVINTPRSWRIGYIIELVNTVADHMFGNIWIMLLIIAGALLFFVYAKLWRKDSPLKAKSMAAILFIFVGVYYIIMIVGGAIAWRYFCAVYPMVALLLGLVFSTLYADPKTALWSKIILVATGMCIPLVAYGSNHISELYTGEKAYREILEEKYHGIDGVMVHHDFQGIGENWLYEAATLWPSESSVLVIQNKVLQERELCYTRESDKILLWLTIDYDREEAIALFKECTDYAVIEPVLHTDHIWVYECSKIEENQKY